MLESSFFLFYTVSAIKIYQIPKGIPEIPNRDLKVFFVNMRFGMKILLMPESCRPLYREMSLGGRLGNSVRANVHLRSRAYDLILSLRSGAQLSDEEAFYLHESLELRDFAPSINTGKKIRAISTVNRALF